METLMLNGMVRGLGFGPDPTGETPSTTTGGSTTSGDKVSSWIDKLLNWGTKAGDIYQSTQNQPGGNGLPPNTYGNGGSAPGMSTGTKVMIGVGVVGLAAVGIYAATRKKK